MRTIRFTQRVDVGDVPPSGADPISMLLFALQQSKEPQGKSPNNFMEFSTEVIINNDDDAKEEGARVQELFMAFLEGMGQVGSS